MNNLFHFNRFWLLAKKTFTEQRWQVVGILLVAVLLSSLTYEPYTLNDTSFFQREIILNLAVMLGGSLLSFLLFSQYNESAKGYHYLLTPASSFEKWLINFLLLHGVFFGVYLLFFRFLDSFHINNFYKLLENTPNLSAAQIKNHKKNINIYAYDSYDFKNLLTLYFYLTGMMAIGATYFNKFALPKTIFLAALPLGAFVHVHDWAMRFFFRDVPIYRGWTYGKVHFNGAAPIEIPDFYASLLQFCFFYGLPIALWWVILLRLRDKEI